MRLLAAATLILSLAACGEPINETAEPASPPPAVVNPAIAGPAAAPEARAVTEPVLTAEGYGPVRIGMTEAEARQALGAGVNGDPGSAGDAQGCHYIWTGQAPAEVAYMVQQGRVTRISLQQPGEVKTDKGLGVGSTAEQVRAAYGADLQAGPHKYVEAPAEYLTIWTRPGERGIKYETNAQGMVTAVHAGDQSIELVEGCS